ncbi:MAG: NAD(P)-dependent oxidoreductase [Anaerolineae bacterium]|jgi:nucleoside-diphosphate-sugar epimerase|nr:NAD(P)-dependent oxidoreductase [Anaerolineae bacterium]
MTETPKVLNVFITGGDTSAGRVLTRELARRGHRVTATTTGSAGAAAIRAAGGLPAYPDMTRPADVRGLLQMARTDVLVHLAAAPLNDIPQYASPQAAAAVAALDATDELVIAAGQAGVKRVLLLSSAFIYGDTGGQPATENTPVRATSPLFKALIHAETAVLDGGIPGYVLRAGYLYGAHSAAARALAQALTLGQAVLAGRHPAAWLHEDDLTAALCRLIEQEGDADTATILNVADDAPASPDAFLDEFGTILGTGVPARFPGLLEPLRATALQRTLLATSVQVSTAALKALGWAPQYPARAAGLERMLMLWRAEAAAEPPPVVLPERAIVTL